MSLPALAVSGYSSIIEDLPLMQGMVEKPDDAVIFDAPDGRIVETIAEISASSADVKKFYAESLPPLGWSAVSDQDFTRDTEILKLSVEQEKGVSYVRFSLSPKKE